MKVRNPEAQTKAREAIATPSTERKFDPGHRASSLWVKFVFWIGAPLLVLFSSLFAISAARDSSETASAFSERTKTESVLLAYSLEVPVFNLDEDSINRVATKFLESPDNVGVQILDDKGRELYKKQDSGVASDPVEVRVDLDHQGSPLGTLLITFSQTRLKGELQQKNGTNAVQYALGFFFTIAVLVFLVWRLILVPLSQIRDKIHQISQGEGDLSQLLQVRSRDELGQTATQFNAFLLQLKGIVVGIRNGLAELSTLKGELNRGSQEQSASVVEISANLTGIKTQIAALDDQMGEVFRSLEQISHSVHLLDQTITTQSVALRNSSTTLTSATSVIREVSEITKQKRQEIQELQKVALNGKDKLEATTTVVDAVAGSLGSITGLLESIRDISAQTNILAMNAAIEAAHAGSAGHGFSVVADEVRKLAESSARTTLEVTSILGSVIKGIEDAQKSGVVARSAFSRLGDQVHSVSVSLEQIDGLNERLAAGSHLVQDAMVVLEKVSVDVDRGSKQVASSVGAITSAAKIVGDRSSQILVGMEEISAGNTLLERAILKMEEQASRLSDSADGLVKEVDRFRTE